MRLLVFSPSYPPRTGGLETHAAQFNQAMAELEEVEAITVFTPLLPGFGDEREKVGDKITIIRFSAFEIIPNYPVPKLWQRKFWQQWRALKRLEPTLVISRTRFFLTSPMALFYARQTRCPHVHIEHGSDFVQLGSKFKSGVAKLYDYTLGAWVLRKSAQNIAISQAVAEFIRKFDNRSVPVVYRGVDQETIMSAPSDTTYRKKFPRALLVVFVGRLIDGKGVADLLPVAKSLATEQIEFLIIGDGPQEVWLKQQIKEQNLNNVHFLGRKPLAEAVGIVKASDVFINPSYTEGLPTSVIEAALCKVAIIATDVGGTREVIEHEKSGLLIPDRNPLAIESAIRLLKAAPERRQKMGEQAHARAVALFSWPQSRDTYKKVFGELPQRDFKRRKVRRA